MSAEAYQWAWKHSLKSVDKLVLLFIAYNADSTNSVCTTYDDIRAATGMDKGTIAKSVKRLVAKGLINRTIRPGYTPMYNVLVHAEVAA